MAQAETLPVFRDGYTLLLLISTTVHALPRVFRYSLGAKVESLGAEVLDCIVVANHSTKKGPSLELALLNLERLKIQTRILYDLKGISVRKYEQIAKHCATIERQLAGWEQWSRQPSGDAAGLNPVLHGRRECAD